MKSQKTKKTTTQNTYELLLIIDPEKKENEVMKAVKKLIEDFGFSIKSEDIWGLRTLAYIIKKKNQGRYVVFYLETQSTQKVVELKKELRMNESIMRFVLVKGK